jgi:hypothetical protein
MIEQRGKKKPEEGLIRFLGKAVDDTNRVMEKFTDTEKVRSRAVFICHKLFLKSFCRSQRPDKFANLSFTITNIRN